MESLLMQIAMAALTQFGGGGGGGGGMALPVRLPMGVGIGGGIGGGMGLPTSLPIRPAAPSFPSQGSAMQASTLAATTCLLRSGQIGRNQAISILDRQGQSRGWTPGWGRNIPIGVVDQTINRAGGCQALLNGIRNAGGIQTVTTQMAGPGSGSRSQREGFGLYPYR